MLFPVTFALDPYNRFIDHFGSGPSHMLHSEHNIALKLFDFPSAMDRMLRLMEEVTPELGLKGRHASHVRIGKGESE